jgi:hypothetical protein
MEYRERNLGTAVAFLLPSLKLKEPRPDGTPAEKRLHDYLMDHFGGYTAQAGNIFGYWREGDRDSYGEHREFTVAVQDAAQISDLKAFLAQMAAELDEECVYFRAGESTALIYPGNRPVGLASGIASYSGNKRQSIRNDGSVT